MTNRIAIWLAIVIVALALTDLLWLGGANLVFLGKKLVELIDLVAVWR